MTILITGSRGQLARELQFELADAGQPVIALGHDQLDLADHERLRTRVRHLQPDLIVNAAAYTAVDSAEREPQRAFAINAVAPGILAEEAYRLGIPLIHFSTDYVFDGHKSDPYVESDRPAPLNVYGRSKLAGEQAVQAVGGQALILRTSWVYSGHGRNFLLTMQRLLQAPGVVTVVDNELGAPTWAGTLASTTARMIRRWHEDARPLHGLYHLTAQGATSWHGFARCIADHLEQRGALRARLEPIHSAEYSTLARRPLNSRLDCTSLIHDWQLDLPHWQTALELCLAENHPCGERPAPHRIRTA